MRLINVDTLELEEFFDEDIPDYAILSHTWGEEEVSFQDLCWLHDYEKNRTTYASLEALMPQIGQNMTSKATTIRQGAGFGKIVQSARLAKERRLEYVWVDTCCIDKTSSTELSEAINSMFRWYQKSFVCLAFLSDVDSRGKRLGAVHFEDARWFTRGWTLQELLAPTVVIFYDRRWKAMGTPKELADKISVITGIPGKALRTQSSLENWSLADRLSWARKRKTSRKEDMAYCLMGLFGVSMPLLYGEGERAFIRLQQEIIKEHGGQSLFAWGHNECLLAHGSIFAPSPALMGSGKMDEDPLSNMAPFNLSNKYLEISLDVFQIPGSSLSGIYYALWDVWFMLAGGLRRGVQQKTHRLCFPLAPAADNKEGFRDGQHYMSKCPSGPLMIAVDHIPDEKSHRRILIAKETPRNWNLGKTWIAVEMDMWGLHQILPSARLVEIFPPAMSMTTVPKPYDTLGRETPWKFWFSTVRQSEVVIFRFLVSKDLKGKLVEAKQSTPLLVVVDFRQPIIPSSTKRATAVKWLDGTEIRDSEEVQWMDASRTTLPRKNDGWENGRCKSEGCSNSRPRSSKYKISKHASSKHEGEGYVGKGTTSEGHEDEDYECSGYSSGFENDPIAFCSLADAAFAGVPLTDAHRWFDNSAPFLVDGEPLEVVALVEISGDSRGQQGSSCFNVLFPYNFDLTNKPGYRITGK